MGWNQRTWRESYVDTRTTYETSHTLHMWDSNTTHYGTVPLFIITGVMFKILHKDRKRAKGGVETGSKHEVLWQHVIIVAEKERSHSRRCVFVTYVLKYKARSSIKSNAIGWQFGLITIRHAEIHVFGWKLWNIKYRNNSQWGYRRRKHLNCLSQGQFFMAMIMNNTYWKWTVSIADWCMVKLSFYHKLSQWINKNFEYL